jgi:pimeloyl-[acyl-carrier protein] synthase
MSTSLDSLLAAPDLIDDPYPTYRRLREEAPVFWSERLNGWVLTCYDDVVKTFVDHAHFKNGGRFEPVFDAVAEPQRAEFEPMRHHYRFGVIGADPPDHTRLRALIQKAFAPRALEAMRAPVQAIIDAQLDAVATRGDGLLDIVRDLANPLPVIVIAQMMGVPASDGPRFKHWSDDVMRFQSGGRASLDDMRTSQTALFDFRAYLEALFAQRRAEPRDDLVTALVQAEDQGERLSEIELLATCVTLLVAGHETTTNLIANGMLALLRNPDQLDQLRARPELIGSAVEEMLRYDTSLQRNRRIVGEDLEFGGQQMRKGQFVMQVIGAANRDPAAFADPERFDITRNPNPHIGFGRGIHFCLGAPLARIEAPLAIQALLRRFPNLRLTGDQLDWRREVGALRSLRALPVCC